MNRHLLLGYQMLTGLSDTSTGLLLIFAPAMTLRLMRLHEIANTLPFLSFVGAFVLSLALPASMAHFSLLAPALRPARVVWLVTAITRASVAVFVVSQVISGTFEVGWCTVALCDGAVALLQGLASGKAG